MNPPTVPARRALVVLWTAVLVFVAALALAATAFLRAQERAALDEGARQMAVIIDGAEAALNRALLAFDMRLNEIGTLLGRGNQEQVLVSLAQRDLMVDHINVVDAQSQVLMSSRGGVVGRRLPLPPGFAAAVLAQPVPQMLLSTPGLNLAMSDTVLHAARAVRTADGQAALAVVELPLSLVAAILAPAGNVTGLHLTLERDDGELLASLPRNDQAAGRRLVPALPAMQLASGVIEAAGRLDQAAALITARPLLHRNLLVGASWQRDALLQRFHRERLMVLAACAMIVFFAVGAGAMTHAYIVRMARARADLAASKTLLDEALGSIAEGFMLCDADDRLVTWNGRIEEMYPWLKAALRVGAPYRDLVVLTAAKLYPEGPDLRRDDWIAQRLASHREAGTVWEQDLGNGMVVQSIERRTPDGGTVSVYSDVTAKERRLEEARRAAEAANAAKSQFLATMSHEIRTPLNAVLGTAALLLNTPLNVRQREYVELMRTSGQNLLTVINDILDVTQIEAGRMSLEQIDFEPAKVFVQAVAVLRVRARDKGLALELDMQPELPPLLRGDPSRLNQVLFNLIGNAIKFTERGSVKVLVRHAPRPGGGAQLTVVVADSGIGMPADALPRLFERFMQVDGSTRRRYGGSGLGLSITRDIVNLMGGLITVQSRVGVGSTFRVELPLQAPLSGHAEDEPELNMDAVVPRRVLVAEDNAVNQVVIRAMLEQLGHRCDVVEDGVEALERLQAGDYDVVLMDMQMPRLDGLAATQAIRALPGSAAGVPILAMTANALNTDRQACRAAGMTGFVAKPVDMNRLARMIEWACAAPGAMPASASRFSELS